MSKNFFNF